MSNRANPEEHEVIPKQYAPGPWHRGVGDDAHKVFDSQGRIVADRCGYDDGSLIACALEMLDVVRFASIKMCDPHAVDTDPAAARLKQMCEAVLKKIG